MAYLLDPGEGKYALEDLALRYLSVELQSPDQVEGTLDHSTGDDAARPRPAGAPRSCSSSSRRSRRRWRRASSTICTGGSSCRSCRCWPRWKRPESASTSTSSSQLGKELGDQCRQAEAEIHALAGEQFNVNSTPQLRRILFEKLGLNPVKRTKTGPVHRRRLPAEDGGGAPDRRDAAAVPGGGEAAQHLRRRAAAARAAPTAASTRRSTSSPPRPAGSRASRRTCRTFPCAPRAVASSGARSSPTMVAPCSPPTTRRSSCACSRTSPNDPGLIEAFERGSDIHTTTAARVFDVDEAKVDAFQRRFAKVVNYGLAYGMEAYGLGQRLDIPTDQAREILDAYFAAFPNVAGYMTETVREAKARGYTTTIFGRRRQLPELSSDNFRIRQMGERMAQNAPVQGSAADIFKLAMIDLDRALTAGEFESRMILTVHDELVLEVPVDEREKVEPVVTSVMENVTELRVPLVVDIGFGHDLGRHEVSEPVAEGARRPLVQRDRRVPRRRRTGRPGRLASRRSRPEPSRKSTSSRRARARARERVLDAGCGPGPARARLSRDAASTWSASISRPTSSRSASASAESLGVARPRAVRGRRPARRWRSTTSSTPWCACARAGSGCSAAARDEGDVLDAVRGGAAAGRPAGGVGVQRVLRRAVPRSGRHIRRRAWASTTSARALRNAGGTEREFDLWTTCFTPRELDAARRGGRPRGRRGARRDARRVRAGRRRRSTCPEFLLLARRPVNRERARYRNLSRRGGGSVALTRCFAEAARRRARRDTQNERSTTAIAGQPPARRRYPR